jgi:two-component system, LytTR family, response regulator LytT
MTLAVLAVDDEPHALADLAEMLAEHEAIGDVQAASNAEEGLKLLAERSFDAVFLDVRMPGMDGTELARVMQCFASAPALVFVTAYGDAAVGAFDLSAIDYVLKPVSRARLAEAVRRVLAFKSRSLVASEGEPAELTLSERGDEVIPVTGRNLSVTLFVPRDGVYFLESYGNYVRVVTRQGRFLHRGTLGELDERWRGHGFLRVHRRFVVNLRRVAGLRTDSGCAFVVFPDSSEVPVARRQLPEVRRRLGT